MTPLSAASHLLLFTLSRDDKMAKYSSASGVWNLSTSFNISAKVETRGCFGRTNKVWIISLIMLISMFCVSKWHREERRGKLFICVPMAVGCNWNKVKLNISLLTNCIPLLCITSERSVYTWNISLPCFYLFYFQRFLFTLSFAQVHCDLLDDCTWILLTVGLGLQGKSYGGHC